MAQLALLLKLRLLLWARQWRLSCALQILVLFGALILLFVVAHATAALVQMHGQLGDEESRRLGQLFSLAITLVLTVAPLTGFRAQEYMDVTQLFTLPLRPVTIFASTVLGGFFGAITMAALPLLILPAAMRRPDRTLAIVATTLAFLAVLHACLQCVTLGFLNVLRSRRFRDIAAVLAPGIGLLIYGSLQGLVFVQLEPGMLPSLVEILSADALKALDRARPFLPPLWYAEAAYGDAPAWPTILAFAAIASALTWLGTRATVHAYYGVVAHAPTQKVASKARGRWIEAMLGTDVAALYAKERSVYRRDPWTRVLLMQQLAFLALIALGENWLMQNSSFPRGFPIALLLFLEAVSCRTNSASRAAPSPTPRACRRAARASCSPRTSYGCAASRSPTRSSSPR